jgi:hypothetical protein
VAGASTVEVRYDLVETVDAAEVCIKVGFMVGTLDEGVIVCGRVEDFGNGGGGECGGVSDSS